MEQAELQDKSAWVRALLERFERPLLRYALRLTHGNLDLARDVVQDTFMRLCSQDLETVRGHEAAWLFTVCRNRFLEVRRKEARVEFLDAIEFAAMPTPQTSPDQAAEARDTQARVRGLIARLPERQQELLRLRFQDGLSYQEISQAMGLSTSNVGFILHTAITSLRRQLHADAPETPGGRTDP